MQPSAVPHLTAPHRHAQHKITAHQHGTARYSTAQKHSTQARHGMARHGTARHSTATYLLWRPRSTQGCRSHSCFLQCYVGNRYTRLSWDCSCWHDRYIDTDGKSEIPSCSVDTDCIGVPMRRSHSYTDQFARYKGCLKNQYCHIHTLQHNRKSETKMKNTKAQKLTTWSDFPNSLICG